MLELVIRQRRRDLGGFEVGRVLPYAGRRDHAYSHSIVAGGLPEIS